MKKTYLFAAAMAIAAISIVPAMAETDSSSSITAVPVSGVTVKTMPIAIDVVTPDVMGSGKEYFSCMAKAVSAREDSYINGLSAFNAAVSSAYSARKTALVSAWNSSSDDRSVVEKAVTTAEQSFKTTRSEAEKNWNLAQKKLAEEFNVSKSACAKLSTVTKPTPTTGTQSLLEMIKKLEAQIKELQAKLMVQKPTIAPTTNSSTVAPSTMTSPSTTTTSPANTGSYGY